MTGERRRTHTLHTPPFPKSKEAVIHSKIHTTWRIKVTARNPPIASLIRVHFYNLRCYQRHNRSIETLRRVILWMAMQRNIDHVLFGQYDIVTWFYSPYPIAPSTSLLPKLYVCPQCFKYTANETSAAAHQVTSTQYRPYIRHYANDKTSLQGALFTVNGTLKFIN